MLKKYYHATEQKNGVSIMTNGIKPGIDDVVYLTEKPNDAALFLAIRGIPVKSIIAFEVELKEEEVFESFDHNKNFFKCDAYYYEDVIKPEEIINCFVFKC